jgi:hyperosmotically inducible protein
MVVRIRITLICVTLLCTGVAEAASAVATTPKTNPQSSQPGASKDAVPKPKAPKKPRHAAKHNSDAEITNKIRQALMRAQDLESADIDVETRAGTVRLSGEVENAKQVARVRQLAAKVKGVKKIENELTVRAASK